jgi:hypothetical protein
MYRGNIYDFIDKLQIYLKRVYGNNIEIELFDMQQIFGRDYVGTDEEDGGRYSFTIETEYDDLTEYLNEDERFEDTIYSFVNEFLTRNRIKRLD